MSTSPLVSAACCCLALLVFFFAASPISCFAELAEWSGGGTEMRKDGTCFVGNLGGLLRPRRVPMPSASFPGCGDPLYRVLRWCARQGFYANPGDQTRPKDIYSDSVLLLLNGCLRCPFGEAVAHIRLRHRLPAGSGLRFALPLLDAIFSECKEQEQLLGNLTVHLSPQWPAGARGTFALGAILMGRSCGWMGTEREKLFDELELEIEHNCGRRRPMTLVIPLPSVDLDRLRGQRGQLLEWDGLSLDLAIFGPGWDRRFVDFEAIKPRKRPQQRQHWQPTLGDGGGGGGGVPSSCPAFWKWALASIGLLCAGLCCLALFYFGHARRLLLTVVGPKEVSVSVNAKPTMHY